MKIFTDLVIFESRLSEKENIGDGEEREEGDEDEHGAGRKKEAKGREEEAADDQQNSQPEVHRISRERKQPL